MSICYLLLSPTFGMHQYTADLSGRMSPHFPVCLLTTTTYPAGAYSPNLATHTPLTTTNTGFSSESLRRPVLRQIYQQLHQLQPALVHLTGPHLWNLFIARFLRQQQIPTIHTIHDIDPHSGGPGRLLYLWNWLICRLVDHILVHGQVYRERLLQQGFPAGQVTATPLLHLFLSHQQATQLTNHPELCQPIPNHPPLILFFGRLEAYKGLDHLLTAWQQLGPNPPARLILAGSGRIEPIWPHPLPAGVERRNHLITDSEAIELFRRCALVVLPYKDATQSAIIAAAYYFQKPVLVTRAGALAEYVVHQQTGFLVDPGQPTQLRQAIDHALNNLNQLASMGRSGRDWYEQQRTQEHQTMLTLYHSLTDGRQIHR